MALISPPMEAAQPFVASNGHAELHPSLHRRPRHIESKWPTFEEDEVAAVVDVLRSGRVNSLHHGGRCRAFEEGFAKLCGVPFAIALANGTLALELALKALQIGPGDEVIVSPRSFVASVSCVVNVGARPVFADVDPVSQNISAETISRVLTERTRAVVAVHLAGWPCDMVELLTLARRHGLKIIEDCAQAHGATYHGQMVGSFGDAAAFSFCTDKIISTGGEGGMLLLRDRADWARAWSYKDHGKDPDCMGQPAGSQFRWLHNSVGSNYRMTEMQAAIGLCQLGKLAERLRVRRRNAALLNQLLAGLPSLRLSLPGPGIVPAYYKYYAFVRPEVLLDGWSRDRIAGEAVARGIPCSVGTCPEIYRERAFADGPFAPPAPLRVASELGETALMLPVDHSLSTTSIRAMGEILRDVLLEAERVAPVAEMPHVLAS